MLASQAQRLEFHPQNPLKKKPSIVACACNPSTEEVETGSLGLIGQLVWSTW